MIAFSKYSSAALESGKRILKSIGIGGSVMTTKESMPFGIDSQPLENWTAIYAETTNKSESVIIGYINKNQIAEPGENRMYALGPEGGISSFVFLKSNGEIWLNSGENSAVLWEGLKNSIDQQNLLINIELMKISTTLAVLGVVYAPGTINANLTAAKSLKVKLK